jgi:transposase
MPYLTEKIPIDCPFLDRRTKLLPCQKERVLMLSKEGYSQRKLAAMFNVSRRLITFIIDPKKKERNYQCRLVNGGSSQYYVGGEEWAKTIKEHRTYKNKVLKPLVKK